MMTGEDFSAHIKTDEVLQAIKEEIVPAQKVLIDIYARAIARTIEIVGIDNTDIVRVTPMVMAVVHGSNDDITLQVLKQIVPDCGARIKEAVLQMIVGEIMEGKTDAIDELFSQRGSMH